MQSTILSDLASEDEYLSAVSFPTTPHPTFSSAKPGETRHIRRNWIHRENAGRRATKEKGGLSSTELVSSGRNSVLGEHQQLSTPKMLRVGWGDGS